nr:hypothetical protein [Tanacetum cinerariifolium]
MGGVFFTYITVIRDVRETVITRLTFTPDQRQLTLALLGYLVDVLPVGDNVHTVAYCPIGCHYNDDGDADDNTEEKVFPPLPCSYACGY